MKDVRNILLTALVPALKTATGKNVYTRIPKAANVAYPYIYISDIYQSESGSKTSYKYELDVLVQVCHLDLEDLSALFTDIDNVLSLINNGANLLALANPYKVMSCELGSSTTTEFQTETGTENVGLIRMLYNIE